MKEIKACLLLIIFLLSFQGKAKEILDLPRFVRTPNGRVLMETLCKDAESIVKSFNDWLGVLEQGKCEATFLRNNNSGYCDYEITKCLPRKVKEVHGLYAFHEGPNCWNSSLFMRGILPALRDSSAVEFQFYLNSPLCKEVTSLERRAGDIGSLEMRKASGQTEFIHSFTFIGEDLVFQKIGRGVSAGYELSSMGKMLEKYPLEPVGECEQDCKLNVSFERHLPPEVFLKFRSKFPNLVFPSPTLVCPQVNENPTRVSSIMEVLLGKSLKKEVEGFLMIDKLITDACSSFKEKEYFIKESGGICEKNCPKPKIHYYRCDSLKTFIDKAKFSKNLIFLQETMRPFEEELEKFLFEDSIKVADIEKKYEALVNKLAKEMKKRNIQPLKLKTEEKRYLAMIGLRLIEMGKPLGILEKMQTAIPEIYQVSYQFIER